MRISGPSIIEVLVSTFGPKKPIEPTPLADGATQEIVERFQAEYEKYTADMTKYRLDSNRCKVNYGAHLANAAFVTAVALSAIALFAGSLIAAGLAVFAGFIYHQTALLVPVVLHGHLTHHEAEQVLYAKQRAFYCTGESPQEFRTEDLGLDNALFMPKVDVKDDNGWKQMAHSVFGYPVWFNRLPEEKAPEAGAPAAASASADSEGKSSSSSSAAASAASRSSRTFVAHHS